MKNLLFLATFLLGFLTMACMLLPDKKSVATPSQQDSVKHQQDSVKQKDATMPKLCRMPDNFQCDTSVRFKFVLSNSYRRRQTLDSITTINSARFTRAFQKLYGDSLLYEAVNRWEWGEVVFDIKWDGSIDMISSHTTPGMRQTALYNFVMEHFWDIVKETISMYDHLFAFSYKKSYLEELKNYDGASIYVNIPMGRLEGIYITARHEKDPKSFFDELYSYEFAPLRTSIDEGIYPKDYKRLHDEAVMRDSLLKINNTDAHPLDSIQQRKEAAKQDTAPTPSSDNPKEIIFF